jgi:hypothetical protein
MPLRLTLSITSPSRGIASAMPLMSIAAGHFEIGCALSVLLYLFLSHCPTFATSLIANGADPKSVQDLLGLRTLDMTMRIYAKIHTHTKRQALAKLPYGLGTLAPEGGLEYPGTVGIPVQNGHPTVPSSERAVVGLT